MTDQKNPAPGDIFSPGAHPECDISVADPGPHALQPGLGHAKGKSMTRSYVFGIVTCAALAAASAAQATCYMSFNNGGEMLGAPVGSCMFMGTEADFATWGAEACNGLTQVFVQPHYNDRIVSIFHATGGRITLLQNVVRDGNSVTYDMAAGTEIVLEAPWREAATVLLCE